ncbi:hypothetical protein ACKKBG_A21060 [Auxenochlorella protothecoides x Auxenochlorella symbiontica]
MGVGQCALACVLLTTLVLLHPSLADVGRGADIQLRAKWNSSTFAHEAAEFLAAQDTAAFWSFAGAFTLPQDSTDCLEHVLRQARSLPPDEPSRRLLGVEVAARLHSPRAELFHAAAARELGDASPSMPCCWASVGGAPFLSLSALRAALAAPATGRASEGPRAFDHVHPGPPEGAPEVPFVALYAPLGNACGAAFHAELRALASAGKITYAWRPLATVACAGDDSSPCLHAGSSLVLPGYGVELAIKNMEYNAADDKGSEPASEAAADAGGDPAGAEDTAPSGTAAVGAARVPAGEGDLEALHAQLEAWRDSAAAETVLTKRQLRRLGLQAAARVAEAPASPLAVLVELAQNLPSYAPLLSAVHVPKNLTRAVDLLQRLLPPASGMLAVNGRLLRARDLSLHDLLGKVRAELALHAALMREAGLGAGAARAALLARTTRGAGAPRGAEAGPRLRLASGRAVAWLNDLESDARYARWPARLESLLVPSFSGRLPGLRRNLLTAVLLFDPASDSAADLGEAARVVLLQGWPLRLGLVPLVRNGAGDEAGARVARLFLGVHATLGPDPALAFLASLAGVDFQSGDEAAAWKQVQLTFKRNWPTWVDKASEDAEPHPALQWTAAQALEAYVDQPDAATLRTLRAGVALARSTGLAGLAASPEASGGVLVICGLVVPLRAGEPVARLVGQALQMELRQVQEDVYLHRLTDDMPDLEDELLELRGAAPRINPRIFPSRQGTGAGGGLEGVPDPSAPRQLALTGPGLGAAARHAAGLAYWKVGDGVETDAPAIIHWAVADVLTREGLSLVLAALQHESSHSRTALLLNSAGGLGEGSLAPLERGLLAMLTRADKPVPALDVAAALESILALPLDTDLGSLSESDIQNTHGLSWAELPDADQVAAAHSRFAREGLRLPRGSSAVVTNGRVVTLQPSGELFVPEDFELLELYARWYQFAGDGDSEEQQAGLEDAGVASSILASGPLDQYELSGRGLWERFPTDELNTVRVGRNDSVPPPLFIQAVVDPLSKQAAMLTPVLAYLHEVLGAEVMLTLNPDRGLADLPVKGFLRYVLPHGDGAPPAARFDGLPADQTLTLGMEVPEPWLVEPVATDHDLDNIRLAELGPGQRLAATFELEALLVTGSAIDLGAARSGDPSQEVHPRGVKLELGPAGKVPLVDTLVMSNLGYFQLKAAPGEWTLGLAPGRSRELFSVARDDELEADQGMEGAAAPRNQGGLTFELPVTVDSLMGHHLRLFLKKDPARLDEDVLAPSPGTGPTVGVWSSLPVWGGKKDEAPAPAKEGEDARIHIFTVSSGTMYERLQKIMILSAVKRTSARLKFWFIKNYMSPQMKAFIPVMARRYDFDYEFVTYKWPTWLHKQSEKQRIIWAYKILFLDVLFPLGLKKVIFCDSDQVVRADLAQLWATDLQGAPYAYTPFCDTNKEMEGFRFWKHGFWKDHLQGLPYHISALYLVDLDRFRTLAAGDKLRILYERLSKDPNSLSNLDQDLPNYAQSIVPIHSLDQEWLWCETWCGAASRPAARTIDLCNNPLTKEPKLQSARRIIAEWPALDREVEELTAAVTAAAGRARELEAVVASDSLFRTRLAPMVEGVVGGQGRDASEL